MYITGYELDKAYGETLCVNCQLMCGRLVTTDKKKMRVTCRHDGKTRRPCWKTCKYFMDKITFQKEYQRLLEQYEYNNKD